MKIHDSLGSKIVAVCDAKLIGATLHEDDKMLDLKGYKEFYVGKKVDEKEVKTALVSFTSANLVGKEVVAIALKMELITKDDVLYIEGIPHVQIYRL